MNKISVIFMSSLFLFSGCGSKEEAGITTQIGIPPLDSKITAHQSRSEEVQANISPLTQTASNPFLTKEEEQAFGELGKAIPIDYLHLSAILYSPLRSRAIIDGRILEIGDYIDNKEVIEIQPEAVILKDAQSQYIVRLKKVEECEG